MSCLPSPRQESDPVISTRVGEKYLNSISYIRLFPPLFDMLSHSISLVAAIALASQVAAAPTLKERAVSGQ